MSQSPRIILAAIDLNSGSTRVLEQAVELAAAKPGSEVHVVTVTDPELPLAVYPAGILPEAQASFSHKTADFCREFLQNRRKEDPNAVLPSVQVHAVVGFASDEIVWLAAHLDADCIIVSTHGRRGLKRLLVGSVAERVVRLAGCPVFVVRDKSHDAPWRVPEIEPVCPECATARKASAGKELWCSRHREHHVRAHVLGYSVVGEDAPHAWSSSTGT